MLDALRYGCNWEVFVYQRPLRYLEENCLSESDVYGHVMTMFLHCYLDFYRRTIGEGSEVAETMGRA